MLFLNQFQLLCLTKSLMISIKEKIAKMRLNNISCRTRQFLNFIPYVEVQVDSHGLQVAFPPLDCKCARGDIDKLLPLWNQVDS